MTKITNIDNKVKTIKLVVYTKRHFHVYRLKEPRNNFVFSFKAEILESAKHIGKSDLVDGLIMQFADHLIDTRFLPVDEKIMIPVDDIDFIDYSLIYDQLTKGEDYG